MYRIPRVCFVCLNHADYECGHCRRQYYCSKFCQTAAWPHHNCFDGPMPDLCQNVRPTVRCMPMPPTGSNVIVLGFQSPNRCTILPQTRYHCLGLQRIMQQINASRPEKFKGLPMVGENVLVNIDDTLYRMRVVRVISRGDIRGILSDFGMRQMCAQRNLYESSDAIDNLEPFTVTIQLKDVKNYSLSPVWDDEFCRLARKMYRIIYQYDIWRGVTLVGTKDNVALNDEIITFAVRIQANVYDRPRPDKQGGSKQQVGLERGDDGVGEGGTDVRGSGTDDSDVRSEDGLGEEEEEEDYDDDDDGEDGEGDTEGDSNRYDDNKDGTDNSGEDESVEDESVEGESVEGESVEGESVEGESVEGESGEDYSGEGDYIDDMLDSSDQDHENPHNDSDP